MANCWPENYIDVSTDGNVANEQVWTIVPEGQTANIGAFIWKGFDDGGKLCFDATDNPSTTTINEFAPTIYGLKDGVLVGTIKKTMVEGSTTMYYIHNGIRYVGEYGADTYTHNNADYISTNFVPDGTQCIIFDDVRSANIKFQPWSADGEEITEIIIDGESVWPTLGLLVSAVATDVTPTSVELTLMAAVDSWNDIYPDNYTVVFDGVTYDVPGNPTDAQNPKKLFEGLDELTTYNFSVQAHKYGYLSSPVETDTVTTTVSGLETRIGSVNVKTWNQSVNPVKVTGWASAELSCLTQGNAAGVYTYDGEMPKVGGKLKIHWPQPTGNLDPGLGNTVVLPTGTWQELKLWENSWNGNEPQGLWVRIGQQLSDQGWSGGFKPTMAIEFEDWGSPIIKTILTNCEDNFGPGPDESDVDLVDS